MISLILNADESTMEDYTEEFKIERGILDIQILGNAPNGYMDIEMIFKDQESKDNYIKEFDME